MLSFKNRVVYAVGFEIGALTLNTLLYTITGGTENSGIKPFLYSVLVTCMALVWNVTFNGMWQKTFGYAKTPKQNLLLAGSYSATFLSMIIPIYSIWFSQTIMQSMLANIAGTTLIGAWAYLYKRGFDKYALPRLAPEI